MKIKIGEKIRLLRKKNDITQDRLAEYLGVTPQSISRWESETCYPDIETLPAIADFFDVNTDELLCIDQSKKNTEIKKFIEEANKVQLKGHFQKGVDIYRKALKKYPSSFQLQIELACSIGAIDNGVKISTELCNEVIDICTRILDDCSDDSIRLRTKAILCFLYYNHLDDKIKALQIAESLPKANSCQELAMAEILHISLPSEKAKENIKSFIRILLHMFKNELAYKMHENPKVCVNALIEELKNLDI